MPRLRSWEAMDPRAAGVNDRLGAKDQLCAPQVFTFGHVRQLDSFSEQMLAQAWDFGAGPGDAPMTIDIDSTIQQVYGKQKQGAAYGYTGVLGEHPLVATRADTGEVLHIRQRKGSAGSGWGAPRFVRETIGRVRRAGATGQLTLRADSGFHSKHVVKACRDHDVRYSITVNQNKAVVRAIEAIPSDSWSDIDYTVGGKAQVAECPYGDGHRLLRWAVGVAVRLGAEHSHELLSCLLVVRLFHICEESSASVEVIGLPTPMSVWLWTRRRHS